MNKVPAILNIDCLVQEQKALPLFIEAAIEAYIAMGTDKPVDWRFANVDAKSLIHAHTYARERMRQVNHEIDEQTFLYRCMLSLADYGHVYVSKWERDCDMASWTERHRFDTMEEVYAWRDQVYSGAEGPVSIGVISKDDFDNFETTERDGVLEAFEDGHPHVIFD